MKLEWEKIKVFIALNDCVEKKMCYELLQRFPGMSIVGEANNGDDALYQICYTTPHIVLADVILPGMDAYTLMDLVKEKVNNAMPYFVLCYSVMPEIFTAVQPSEYVMHYILFPMREAVLQKQLGLCIEYYLEKKRQIKSEAILEEVTLKKEMIEKKKDPESMLNSRQKEWFKKAKQDEFHNIEARWEEIVGYEIGNLGGLSTYKGYYYLIDAISQVIREKGDGRFCVTKLYPEIAKKKQTTSSGVEKAIRTSIQQIWEKGNENYLKKFWGINCIEQDNRPGNSNFICYVAQKIKRDYSLLP